MRAALVILLALALAAPVPAATVTVTAHLRHVNRAPLPPRGRAGDADSSRWLVRDRHARPIGELLIDCRWVTFGLRLCVGEVDLPLGTIAVQGASRTRIVGQFAVVGGTGRYVGAAGAMTFAATSSRRYVLSIFYRQ